MSERLTKGSGIPHALAATALSVAKELATATEVPEKAALIERLDAAIERMRCERDTKGVPYVNWKDEAFGLTPELLKSLDLGWNPPALPDDKSE